MPRKTKPSYLLHKPTGQARVRIEGRDIYLGAHGTPESNERYEELVSNWLIRNQDPALHAMTIDELALLYLEHAHKHYRKNGRITNEIACIKTPLRYVIAESGRTRAWKYGPKTLKKARDVMVRDGHCRTSINKLMSRVRRMFKWAIAEELVPADKQFDAGRAEIICSSKPCRQAVARSRQPATHFQKFQAVVNIAE